MAQHIIENEHIRVTVNDDGAELASVVDKLTGTERIWSADPSVWNRHAPILFPFVGKVIDGKYLVGNQEYSMKTQHGFARDMTFQLVECSPTSVTHALVSTEETKAIYPYDFRLTVRHSLEQGSVLSIEWKVENTGKADMYFSIGGHPGFTLPEGIRKEDCYILFPEKDALTCISANEKGYAVLDKKTLALKNGRIRYRDDIPDTWIFEDGQVKQVGIALPDGTPYVMLHCHTFPILAVWAKGPFICLEPWFGRTDDNGFTGTIDQKAGIQRLAAGEAMSIFYAIDFAPELSY